MRLFHDAVFDNEGVALAAVAAEDGGAVEGEVEGVSEGEGGVGEEADLCEKEGLVWAGRKEWNGVGGGGERVDRKAEHARVVMRDVLVEEGIEIKLTPLLPDGSRTLPQAFVLWGC
jgi:hypothetical protein